MLILGIESATDQVGCALGDQHRVLASAHVSLGRRHAESLVPSLDFTCRQAGVALAEVTVVAVDLGPGLFTGLRVGIATGKAVALALRVPMIGVSSLDLLAFPVRFTRRLIGAVIDARRGELFYAFYRHVPGGAQRVSEVRVGGPDDLVSELVASREDCLLVGDGAMRYAETFAAVDRVEVEGPSLAHPSACSLVELARPRALREEWMPPHELEPLYLRAPDADINWSTRDDHLVGGGLRDGSV